MDRPLFDNPNNALYWRDYYSEGYCINVILAQVCEDGTRPSIYWYQRMYEPVTSRDMRGEVILVTGKDQIQNIYPKLAILRPSGRMGIVQMCISMYKPENDLPKYEDLGNIPINIDYSFMVRVAGAKSLATGFDIEAKRTPPDLKEKLLFEVKLGTGVMYLPKAAEMHILNQEPFKSWLPRIKLKAPRDFPVFFTKEVKTTGEVYLEY